MRFWPTIASIFFGSVIIFVISIPFFIVTSGLWIPYRLQKSGEIQKEVVKEIDSHFHFFVPPLQYKYFLTCKKHPDYDYVGSNSFLKQLQVGDTIHVFSSAKVKAGYCIEGDANEFKPPTNILAAMYSFRPLASIFTVILLFAISFVFIVCCNEVKQNIHKNVRIKYNGDVHLSKWLEFIVLLNLSTYVFVSISFFYLIVKSSFLVEQSGPYVAGFVSFLGTSIGVLSPVWLYQIKKFWESDKIILFFIKSLALFSFGLYSSVKLILFINKEDISTFESIFDLIIYFFKQLF